MVEQNSRDGAETLDLGILVGLAYQRFCDQLWQALGGQGYRDLGPAYGYVFRALAAEELSQRELAQGLAITDQGMAKIVNEMVERGYVERHPDPADGRVKRLRLARRGRAALAAARAFHAAFEQALEKDVGAAAVKSLRRTLEKVARAGGAEDEDLAQARLRPL